MTEHDALVSRYIDTWNETNPSRRDALAELVLLDDASYTDPMMSSTGAKGFAEMIGAFQAQMPGLTCERVGGIDATGALVRFSWRLIDAGGRQLSIIKSKGGQRRRGARVVAETCPQYLLLREDEVIAHGAFRKFTPPARIRSSGDEEAMWAGLRDGRVHHLSTDHAPSTRAQKSVGVWASPFGLPGLDSTLPLMLDAALTESLEEASHRHGDLLGSCRSARPSRWRYRPACRADFDFL